MLTFPRRGLKEITSVWTGDGKLMELVSAVTEPNELIAWTPDEVRSRARRVLFGLLEPCIAQWPTSLRHWEQRLPTATSTERLLSSTLQSRIDWISTARDHGWPPRRYVVRARRRVVGGVAIEILTWLSAELSHALARLDPQDSPLLIDRIAPQVCLLREVVERFAHDIEPVQPSDVELRSLEFAGPPWRAVAQAAHLVLRAARDPEFLAFELLEPDVELQWRLFHVSAFGYAIGGLRSAQCSLRWNMPLRGLRTGPQLSATQPNGQSWDLWFESAGARSHYDLGPSTYASALAGIPDTGGTIGPDVLLIRPGESALVLECKWSADASYVGRDGYHQVSSYVLDTLNGLAPQVWGFVVGPEEVVPTTSIGWEARRSMNIVLGSTNAPELPSLVRSFLDDEPDSLGASRLRALPANPILGDR